MDSPGTPFVHHKENKLTLTKQEQMVAQLAAKAAKEAAIAEQQEQFEAAKLRGKENAPVAPSSDIADLQQRNDILLNKLVEQEERNMARQAELEKMIQRLSLGQPLEEPEPEVELTETEQLEKRIRELEGQLLTGESAHSKVGLHKLYFLPQPSTDKEGKPTIRTTHFYGHTSPGLPFWPGNVIRDFPYDHRDMRAHAYVTKALGLQMMALDRMAGPPPAKILIGPCMYEWANPAEVEADKSHEIAILRDSRAWNDAQEKLNKKKSQVSG